MKTSSINWNEAIGVCQKHGCPQLPCPACMSSGDEDVEFHIPEYICDGVSIEDLLPKGFSIETHVVRIV
jgi:hypothetical protein